VTITSELEALLEEEAEEHLGGNPSAPTIVYQSKVVPTITVHIYRRGDSLNGH
jgi:hypothetical protein